MTSANGSRGRHGRAPTRQSPSDAAVRRRMVRLAVLPAAITATAGAAVVAYVMSTRGGPGASVADDAAVWGVLGGALLFVGGVVVGAAYFASTEARRAVERYGLLRRSIARSQSEVHSLLRSLEQGERPRPRPHPVLPEPAAGADAFDMLTHELALAQRVAESAVTEAAALVRSNSSGSEEKVEVFVNLARRLQSLVHREIELLDELENEVEDPDLLKGLFHVDHLATRIRRHAENLAVLGGAVSRRQWSRPVTMTEVLRSSIAEVEQYPRVKLVPPIEGTLRGHAVADVIHLLAELVENATVFSAPQTQVLLRAQHVTAGLAIEVEDRGLGMTVTEQNRMNAVLSDPERIDVGELLQDGRIGLFVVSALAQRHGIVVQLQSNIYGGIQAVLVLPREVLGEETGSPAHAGSSRAANGTGSSNGSGGNGTSPSSTAAAAAGATAQVSRLRPERVELPQPSVPEPVGAVPQPATAQPQSQPHAQPQPPSQPHAQPEPLSQPHAQPAPLPVRDMPRAPGAQPSGGRQRAAQASPQTPPRARPPSPSPASPVADAPRGERPELPKRRRQEHLAPELREAPPSHHGDGSASAGWDEGAQGHDPGLLAAFRRGTSLAEDSDGNDAARPSH